MSPTTAAVAEAPMPAGTAVPGQVLEQSYRDFRQRLYAFLRARVHDPAVAEDLLQEVFEKAMGALDGGETPANLSAWLHRIASNTLVDHYRRHRPTTELPEDLAAATTSPGVTPEQVLAMCLEPFVRELPPIYRDVMVASALEGRSLADISRELGLSHSAIKSRVSRGRRMLREKVLACCHVDAAASGEVLAYQRR